MVSQAVGYDAFQKVKGRKRFVTVDTLGLVLRVLVTAASVDERSGGKQVLKSVKQMGNTVSAFEQRLRAITGNLKDVYLPCHDSYYGKAFGIESDLSSLFKHPLGYF